MSQAALQHRPLERRRDGNAEARIQAAVVAWVGWVCPSVIVYAIPNGGLRSKSEAARMKWTGTLSGMPDLGLVLPGGQAGFFEIKTPKRGRLSDAQSEMLPRLEMRGARCAVVRSIDDARSAFKAWGVQMREAFA